MLSRFSQEFFSNSNPSPSFGTGKGCLVSILAYAACGLQDGAATERACVPHRTASHCNDCSIIYLQEAWGPSCPTVAK